MKAQGAARAGLHHAPSWCACLPRTLTARNVSLPATQGAYNCAAAAHPYMKEAGRGKVTRAPWIAWARGRS